jgi:hypothetical protein
VLHQVLRRSIVDIQNQIFKVLVQKLNTRLINTTNRLAQDNESEVQSMTEEDDEVEPYLRMRCLEADGTEHMSDRCSF